MSVSVTWNAEMNAFHLARLLCIFYIKLKQGLDVVAGKCYRDEHNLFLSQAGKPFESFPRLHPHPRGRSYLRLPYKSVRIRVAQPIHYGRNRRGYLENIRVPTVDNRHW